MAVNDSTDPVVAVFQQQERERNVRAEIDATLVQLVKAQEQLDAVRKRLVRKPAWEHEAESFLVPAVTERGRLAEKLGLLCAEWRLQGGEITLSRPSDEVPRSAPAVIAPVPTPPPSAPISAPQKPPSEPIPVVVAPEAPPSVVVQPPPPATVSEPIAPLPSPRSAPVETPSEPTANAEQLAAFKESFLKGATMSTLAVKNPASGEWRTTLTQILALAGPPPDPFDEKERDRELAVLELVTDDKHVAMWPTLPKEVQRPLMGLLVARCRGMKDVASLRIDHRAHVQDILRRFPAYASQERPGHVNGLRVDHRAQGRSWFEDARGYWDHLQTMLPVDEPPKLVPRTEPAPKPKKKIAKKKEVEADEEKREIVPSDWALWPLVRGRHAVIIGGEPRETSRERLEQVFELADLEWVPGDATRKHEGLVERIASHRVELVLVIQNLVTHKAADKLVDACKQHQVAWAFVSGYGATAVQQGLERYVDRK